METNEPNLNDAIDALKQGRVEDALRLWRDAQESEGICDLTLCGHSPYYGTCCANHFQGKLLTLSLTKQGQGYFQLSKKLGNWIKGQNTQEQEGREKGAERFTLGDGMIIGHPTIDHDHRDLVKIINDIAISLENEDYEKCSRLLNDFFERAERHFHKEEKILKEVGFPEFAEHQDSHNQLLEKSKNITKMVSELAESELARERFFTELASFLLDDVIKEDLVFKSFLMKRGVHH